MKDHRRRKGEHGMEKTIGHKQMLKLFLTIALPVALQNLLTYAVGLMDSIMVGSLGEVQLSAVTVAGQPFFLFMMCMFGLSSGACVLISQYWGKKDKDTISRIFGIVLRIAVLVGVGVTAVALLFPHGVMGLYTNEQPVIEYGVQYLHRDFSPRFREGQDRARELGLYMQKYCGCIFSEEDRYKKKPKKKKPEVDALQTAEKLV